MNALHTDLLLLLRPVRDYGAGEAWLLTRLRQEGHRTLTLPEVQAALRELADKGWISPFDSPLSGKRWRISAVGTSVLAEEGLPST